MEKYLTESILTLGAFLWKNSKLDSCLNLERNFLFLYTETDFKPKLRVDFRPRPNVKLLVRRTKIWVYFYEKFDAWLS